jgi:ankyrin repeat protein
MRNELHCCAESGNLEKVTQLVEGGANIDETDEDGMTALAMASLKVRFEIVVYLVKHGANIAHKRQ